MEKIQDHMEFLLSAALRKCGNLQDAEDLAQETILAALLYEAKGKQIDKIRPWLAAVMNRKYCDMLRRRYRQPFISMGEDFDMACEFPFPDDFEAMDEVECARREIAFLTATYREVMVRHYMEGQGVAEIAEALGIPEGTVKSRLSAGRSHVRKGMDEMEYYERQSYKPIRLSVSNSGCSGVNREPGSLVEGDLIAQNLLYLAYEKPVSEAELARAIGIPMAYVEPIIQKLVECNILHYEGSRPALSVPVLYKVDMETLDFLLNKAQAELADILKKPLKEFLKGKKKPIPAHLGSVPLQKQYMYSNQAMLMITLRQAVQKGLIHAGDYDQGAQPPCPMILVIDK